MKRYFLSTLPSALAVLAAAAMFGCGRDDVIHFRRATLQDLCATTPLYAKPDEKYYVGRLYAKALVSDGAREATAYALTVPVDDSDSRSVWRREEEVLRWYVRTDQLLCESYAKHPAPDEDGIDRRVLWSSAPTHWAPTNLEFSLDDRLWLRRFGRGWSSKPWWGATDFSV